MKGNNDTYKHNNTKETFKPTGLGLQFFYLCNALCFYNKCNIAFMCNLLTNAKKIIHFLFSYFPHCSIGSETKNDLISIYESRDF